MRAARSDDQEREVEQFKADMAHARRTLLLCANYIESRGGRICADAVRAIARRYFTFTDTPPAIRALPQPRSFTNELR